MLKSFQLRKDAQAKAKEAVILGGDGGSLIATLSAEDNAKLETLLNDADELNAQAALSETEENEARARAEHLAGRLIKTAGPQGRKTQADAPSQKIIVGKDRLELDPFHGFSGSPRKMQRDFLLAVINAERTGRADARIADLWATVGSDEQSTFDQSRGGFLLAETIFPGLLTTPVEDDPIAPRVMQIPMQTPRVKINARTDKDHTSSVSGGLVVTRRAESSDAIASRMEIEQIALDADMLMGLSYITEELLTDSPISFTAIIAAGFGQEFANKLINERISGTGVGEYMGILNSPCLVSIAKEGSQVAQTIVYQNVLKMRARCWGYENAIWVANHACYPTLAVMVLPVGLGGNSIYIGSAVSDRPDMLLGRPIYYREQAKNVGTKGDIILGNWSQYLEGEYQPMQSAESIHVRFVQHERALKFWKRNAGAPWWRVPLTPQNSAPTLSPFITLDTRA